MVSRASAADIQWASVAYGNRLWVAVAVDGAVMTSPNVVKNISLN
jgi:hypothetical protein